MNEMAEEIEDKIIKNLSLKERVLMREVNKRMKLRIKEKIMHGYKLEESLRRINRIEIRMKKDLVCEYISNIKFYKEERIHKYFRVREKNTRCVSGCGGVRMGSVYYVTEREKNLQMQRYNKRYIPYCINCFSIVNNIV
jgi:hypothetical protein